MTGRQDMDYYVAFDASQPNLGNWAFALIPLAVCLIGAAMIAFNRRAKAERRRLLPYVGTFFGGVVFCLFVIRGVLEHERLTDRLQSGRFVVVEGVVENFVPMRAGGKGYERFVVAGHEYHYSENMPSFSFNQTRSSGGPIRPGIRVRIADVDGVIARLEVAY